MHSYNLQLARPKGGASSEPSLTTRQSDAKITPWQTISNLSTLCFQPCKVGHFPAQRSLGAQPLVPVPVRHALRFNT
jgi:hypothetical protein